MYVSLYSMHQTPWISGRSYAENESSPTQPQSLRRFKKYNPCHQNTVPSNSLFHDLNLCPSGSRYTSNQAGTISPSAQWIRLANTLSIYSVFSVALRVSAYTLAATTRTTRRVPMLIQSIFSRQKASMLLQTPPDLTIHSHSISDVMFAPFGMQLRNYNMIPYFWWTLAL